MKPVDQRFFSFGQDIGLDFINPELLRDSFRGADIITCRHNDLEPGSV